VPSSSSGPILLFTLKSPRRGLFDFYAQNHRERFSDFFFATSCLTHAAMGFCFLFFSSLILIRIWDFEWGQKAAALRPKSSQLFSAILLCDCHPIGNKSKAAHALFFAQLHGVEAVATLSEPRVSLVAGRNYVASLSEYLNICAVLYLATRQLAAAQAKSQSHSQSQLPDRFSDANPNRPASCFPHQNRQFFILLFSYFRVQH